MEPMNRTGWMLVSALLAAAGCLETGIDAGSATSVANESDLEYGENGRLVFPCPEEAGDVVPEGVELRAAYVLGDELMLDVEVDGAEGCGQQRLSVCYDTELLGSEFGHASVRLLRDDGGNACEGRLQGRFAFDLRPLVDAYEERYQTRSGIVEILGGPYAFGTLSCEDREYAAGEQVAVLLDQAPHHCSDASDCEIVEGDTSCQRAADGVVNRNAAAATRDAIREIEARYCTDFAEDGCGPRRTGGYDSELEVLCNFGRCFLEETAFAR